MECEDGRMDGSGGRWNCRRRKEVSVDFVGVAKSWTKPPREGMDDILETYLDWTSPVI